MSAGKSADFFPLSNYDSSTHKLRELNESSSPLIEISNLLVSSASLSAGKQVR